MSDNFYAYELTYPESMGGTVFYVGKGQGNRIHAYLAEARSGMQSKKCDIIRQIWNAGGQVREVKVRTGITETEAYALECSLIEKYGIENLTNIGPGGLGRPSQGRSVRLQATITPEQMAWLEKQATPEDKGVSDIVYRLISEMIAQDGAIII